MTKRFSLLLLLLLLAGPLLAAPAEEPAQSATRSPTPTFVAGVAAGGAGAELPPMDQFGSFRAVCAKLFGKCSCFAADDRCGFRGCYLTCGDMFDIDI